MFSINDRDVRALERRLKLIKSRALPFATREVLNRTAFDARYEAQSFINREMVLRNKYTVNSIRVDRAQGLNISTQKSVMGSIADYMDEQEEGGTKNRKRGASVSIPTSFSAGQRGARPRTRMPRSAFKMSAINLRRNASKAKNQRQMNAINIATSLGGFTYLNLGKRRGIFKIDKKGNPTMVHDFSRTSVRIPATHWMTRSTQKALLKQPITYKRALDYQISRL